jgi:hypothetical protein
MEIVKVYLWLRLHHRLKGFSSTEELQTVDTQRWNKCREEVRDETLEEI